MPAAQLVSKSYLKLLYSLCVISGLSLVVVTLMVIANVIGRATGSFSLIWVSAVSEYVIQFATVLAAPYILRGKGHIFMTVMNDALPKAPQVILEKIVHFICFVLCWGIAAFAVKIGISAFTRGKIDLRSIDIPGWVLYFSLFLGFGLLGIEFLIYLFGRNSMYSDHDVEGL